MVENEVHHHRSTSQHYPSHFLEQHLGYRWASKGEGSEGVLGGPKHGVVAWSSLDHAPVAAQEGAWALGKCRGGGEEAMAGIMSGVSDGGVSEGISGAKWRQFRMLCIFGEGFRE